MNTSLICPSQNGSDWNFSFVFSQLDPEYTDFFPLPQDMQAESTLAAPPPTATPLPLLPVVKSVRFALPPPPGTTDFDVGNQEYQYASPMAAADQEYTNQQQTYQQQPYNSYQYGQRKPSPTKKINPPVAAVTASTSGAQSGPGFYVDSGRPMKRKAGKCRSVYGRVREVFDDENVVLCFHTDSIPHKVDASLPPEIKKLMQALCCELCNVKLNSSISAKAHYDSKVHEKKVRQWLLEWAGKTGQPIPERPEVSFVYIIEVIFLSSSDTNFDFSRNHRPVQAHYIVRNAISH